VDGTNVNRSLRKVIAADFLYAGDNPLTATHWDNNGHGTHVAGHAAGAHLDTPLSNHVQNGMAPGAFVIAQDAGYTGSDNCADLIGLGCPVTNFLPALRQAYLQGARLHNNSWGDNENGVFTNRNAYTQASRDLDAVTWSNRDFLVVCAAGNDYNNDQVASPSNAKNGLSVAASSNSVGQEGMTHFSSRGWAQDGRIKPDLAAPGDNVIAALSDGSIVSSNCTTTGGGGTSYASPLVAGLGALVRDYFASGFHPGGQPAASNEAAYVSAALVKAVLIHSCMAMSNAVAPPPARDQGWGRVQLSRALSISNSAQRLRVWDEPLPLTATPAQPFVRYFDVQGTNVPFKVTLVWTDYPGTPGASRQLVNDLDLRVQAAGALFRGNVWTGGWSATGGSVDRTNNVEQVAWKVPSTGLVEVSVWAHVVPEATQHFALVVSGDAQEVPRDLDQDGDLLPDFWERWHFGGLATTQGTNDFDGDGQRDAEECVAGTEPTNGLSFLAFDHAEVNEEGAVDLSAPAAPGRLYQVWLADGAAVVDGQAFAAYSNFAVGVGTRIAGHPESNAAVMFVDNFTSTNSGGPDLQGGRLYRLQVQAPP
jgi:serine protease AprX